MAIISKPKSDTNKSQKPLSLSFSNINGLPSKFTDIESYPHHSSPDIFGLSETYLNSSIGSSEFSVAGVLPLSYVDLFLVTLMYIILTGSHLSPIALIPLVFTLATLLFHTR